MIERASLQAGADPRQIAWDPCNEL